MMHTTSPVLFQASVSVFLRCMDQLVRLLELARQYAARVGMPEPAVLDAALAPDMLPFATQVEIACNFSLRITFPLAGFSIPPYGTYERSFQGLQQRNLLGQQWTPLNLAMTLQR